MEKPTRLRPISMEENTWISYFEYPSVDFASDIKSIADDPETQKWWRETDACQIPLPQKRTGSRWSELEMVFRME